MKRKQTKYIRYQQYLHDEKEENKLHRVVIYKNYTSNSFDAFDYV